MVKKLREKNVSAGIRIIGGAAISLCYFERRTTSDIDADILPLEPVLEVALEVAIEEGWPQDWLNNAASGYIPFVSEATKWIKIFDDGSVTISVADVRTLLAMKLNASRPGRDVQDIANLLSLSGITTLEEVDEMMDEFYLGDGLSEQALRILRPIFEKGIPTGVVSPPKPEFSIEIDPDSP
ncbi:MAG: DUF6036 family nucleotidyltransferase [Actinomycetota bacterium]